MCQDFVQRLAIFLLLPAMLYHVILQITAAFVKQILENLPMDRMCHLVSNSLLPKVLKAESNQTVCLR